MNNSNELYSYHVFLFPFQWHYSGNKFLGKTFEEKTNLNEFISFLSKTPWKSQPFKTNTVLNYNEYNYFYDFVRQAMYYERPADDLHNENLHDGFLAHFEYDIPMDQETYTIYIRKPGFNRTYELLIDSILLHLYNTGVGVLSFHLNNRNIDQSSPDDILNINQFGRRLFPPFFGMRTEITGAIDQCSYNDFTEGLASVKNAELASEIELSITGREDFSDYTHAGYFSRNTFRMPRFIKGLFGDVPLLCDKNDNAPAMTKIEIAPLLDDRMFVVCWYGNDELSNKYKPPKKDGKFNMESLAYLNDDWWYQYIFVDSSGSKTCQNNKLSSALVEKQTNARWINYGSLFGVSRYSFVCLTASLDSLKDYGSAFLLNHVQTMYYKMTELCLLQRACVLRFSDEVTAISAMKDKDRKLLPGMVSSLYKQYLRFVNKIYFREITAQEQGIELYDLMQDSMNIKNQVKDLDDEISELHDYVTLVEEEKQSSNIALLTLIGALFIIPSFIASFFGMNMFNITGDEFKVNFWTVWLVTPAMLLSASIFFLFLKNRSLTKRKKSFRTGIIIISLIVFVLTLIAGLCFYK
ncbi:MAG TPA: CorA family divalent cation transporter [Bacteroidales bacterium]|nr:magnesium transporter CorA family protein [Paludibacteraceae bacterium]HPI31212.1 CorA family divalent cation transporter [Bacteroidales bacterium]HQN17384.1 CorA family divalent cation transporter [Bacteroidales bacterium]